jgi:hypothetical protein
MCLTIDPDASLQTADEDIIVFKHIIPTYNSSLFLSSFQCADVRLNVMYESQLIVNYWNKEEVHVGLHSYVTYEQAKEANEYWNEQLVECIIPKGAHYYEGTFEDKGPSYASDRLKYIKLID